MNRDDLLQRLDDKNTPWDLIIIGGGATGLGAAIEASSRGYRTLLLEQHDFIVKCENYIDKIAKHCTDITAIVGSPTINPNKKGKQL